MTAATLGLSDDPGGILERTTAVPMMEAIGYFPVTDAKVSR